MKCYKCSYNLDDREIYCPRCGTIATDIKEGLNLKFFIPLRWCRTLGVLLLILAIIIYGICFCITKRIHITYFGASIFLATIGIVYIARSYDSLAMLRQRSKTVPRKSKSPVFCQYCYHEVKGRDIYCGMCGYKRK